MIIKLEKESAGLLLKGLETYHAQVNALFTKAMKLRMVDQAKSIKKEMDEIQNLVDTIQDLTLETYGQEQTPSKATKKK